MRVVKHENTAYRGAPVRAALAHPSGHAYVQS